MQRQRTEKHPKKVRKPRQFKPVTDRITRIEIPRQLLRLVLTEPPIIGDPPTTLEERMKDLEEVKKRVKQALDAYKKRNRNLAERIARELVKRVKDQQLERSCGIKMKVVQTAGMTIMSPADPKEKYLDEWGGYAMKQYPFGSAEERAVIAEKIKAALQPKSLDLASGVSPYYIPDVAVDGSKAMLLRNPAQTRLFGNLDEIILGARLPFSDASFETATVVFGEKYFYGPPLIYREARRLLTPSGKLLVVNGRRGEEERLLRDDDPDKTLEWLKWAGFKKIETELLFQGWAPQGFDRYANVFTASTR